jgi:hypothetical protein
MNNNQYSPLTDASGCLMSWYTWAGNIIGIAAYGIVAIKLLAQGDLCGFFAWTLFLGWIVAPLLGVVWPITIYFVLTGVFTIMP